MKFFEIFLSLFFFPTSGLFWIYPSAHPAASGDFQAEKAAPSLLGRNSTPPTSINPCIHALVGCLRFVANSLRVDWDISDISSWRAFIHPGLLDRDMVMNALHDMPEALL